MTPETPDASPEAGMHSARIKRLLEALIDEARRDVHLVKEPKFQALLETSAEVLNGIRTAFEDYDRAVEPAWRR